MAVIENMLGCRYPIIQGGMGIISNPEMVAAVLQAGGYGLLAPSFVGNSDIFQEQVRKTKQLTKRPFGANLQVMNPMVNQFTRVLADEGVKVVTVSGGSPKFLIPLIHQKGMKAIVVVSNAVNAKKCEDMGADALIAEGSESGGLQGFGGPSTMVLVPAVVDAVKIPVIAAGGIADSRGFRAALALGAKGVQVGTRFIASKECVAHKNYKNLVISSNETETTLVNMGMFQIRALRTPRALNHQQTGGGTFSSDGFSAKSLEQAWIGGDLDAGFLPGGQVSGLVKNILSVREIIEQMVR